MLLFSMFQTGNDLVINGSFEWMAETFLLFCVTYAQLQTSYYPRDSGQS